MMITTYLLLHLAAGGADMSSSVTCHARHIDRALVIVDLGAGSGS